MMCILLSSLSLLLSSSLPPSPSLSPLLSSSLSLSLSLSLFLYSGGVRNGSSSELLHARQTVVTVARANGLVAIDMVHNDFNGIIQYIQ